MSYIGRTNNFNRRFKQHFNALRKNTHPNSSLQSDYNRFSESDFVFHVLEVKTDMVNSRLTEKRYIEFFEKLNGVYNKSDPENEWHKSLDKEYIDFLLDKENLDVYNIELLHLENFVFETCKQGFYKISDMLYQPNGVKYFYYDNLIQRLKEKLPSHIVNDERFPFIIKNIFSDLGVSISISNKKIKGVSLLTLGCEKEKYILFKAIHQNKHSFTYKMKNNLKLKEIVLSDFICKEIKRCGKCHFNDLLKHLIKMQVLEKSELTSEIGTKIRRYISKRYPLKFATDTEVDARREYEAIVNGRAKSAYIIEGIDTKEKISLNKIDDIEISNLKNYFNIPDNILVIKNKISATFEIRGYVALDEIIQYLIKEGVANESFSFNSDLLKILETIIRNNVFDTMLSICKIKTYKEILLDFNIHIDWSKYTEEDRIILPRSTVAEMSKSIK